MTLTCGRCSFAIDGMPGSTDEFRMFTSGTAGDKEYFCNPACYMYKKRVYPHTSSVEGWVDRMQNLYPEVASSFVMPPESVLKSKDELDKDFEPDSGDEACSTGRWADE